MQTYSYLAIHPDDNERDKGVIDAETVSEAHKKLRDQGLRVLSIKPAKKGFTFKNPLKRVSLKDKIIFTRQLSVMIKAGLPLIKAMDALSRQTENPYFKEIIHLMIKDVQGGMPMSKAMQKYPKIFPNLYISVIKAGEQSGKVAEVLLNLADQQEKDADLVGKIKGAMIYPAIIMLALVAVVLLVIFYVLPGLQGVFAESGAKLPIATRILLGSSDIIRKYYYILIALIIGFVFAWKYWGKTNAGIRFFDKMKISLPVFGSLNKKVSIARFARTLAMLVKANLPILQSLTVVKETIDNFYYQKAFDRVRKLVEGGKTMSSALEKESVFPPMVTQLIALGEESGNLEASLIEVANFFDKEVDATSRNLSTMLEPILMIVMGVGVAFVVIAVLGPIYSLVQNF